MSYSPFEIIRDVARKSIDNRFDRFGGKMTFDPQTKPFSGTDVRADVATNKRFFSIEISYWGQNPDGSKDIVGE